MTDTIEKLLNDRDNLEKRITDISNQISVINNKICHKTIQAMDTLLKSNNIDSFDISDSIYHLLWAYVHKFSDRVQTDDSDELFFKGIKLRRNNSIIGYEFTANHKYKLT